MVHIYKTKGVCARQISVEIDDTETILNVEFIGGCPGNLLGISKLVVGKKASEVISDLRGTICGDKITSCPDQLTYALEEMTSKV